MPRKLLSQLFNRPEEPYVRPTLERYDSIDSIASDATAPNNPGPGRNVGLVYDALGARLEHVLGKITATPRAELRLQLELVPRWSNSVESIASDATAPNIPGPGRTLGLLLDAVGGRIERFLNDMAGRRGLGPQAVAGDISSLRRYETDDTRWRVGVMSTAIVAPTNQELRRYKKLCRKLLKYCRSHILATQLEALEAVTTLATLDPYLRQVLAGLLRDSFLAPRYKEQELHTRSSKALISVKENEVYDFFSRFIFHLPAANSSRPGPNNTLFLHSNYGEYDPFLMHQLVTYLRDADISFLLIRLLNNAQPYFFRRNGVYIPYFEAAAQDPDIIEWETLRQVFELVFLYSHFDFNFSGESLLQLAHNFPVLHLFHARYGKSPSLAASTSNSTAVVTVLNYLSGSEDLATQLRYLRNLDEGTRKLFQGTVFASEILIACAHCTTPSYVFELDHTRLSCYKTAAAILFEYSLHGDLDERNLAKAAISSSIASCRYFKHAYATLASEAVDMLSWSKISESEAPYEVAQTIGRREFVKNKNVRLAKKGMDTHKDDVLLYRSGLNCWLEVVGNEHPFGATGHFPVLAGFDTSGKEIYVARVRVDDIPYWIYSYVSDGARDIRIGGRDGKVEEEVFDRFQVLVLRHDPCDLGGFPHVSAGAKLQTGPDFWIRDEGEFEYLEEGADTSV